MSKVIKEIIMKYDKKSDKFVKEEGAAAPTRVGAAAPIYDLVEDIVDYRNEMINQRKINKELALKKIKEIKELEEIELEKVELVKVKDQKITNFQCECGCYLIRKDGMERHIKTKKHTNLMALKVLNDQMIKLSKNPPLGPVKTKAPSMGGEISYITVEKSRK